MALISTCLYPESADDHLLPLAMFDTSITTPTISLVMFQPTFPASIFSTIGSRNLTKSVIL